MNFGRRYGLIGANGSGKSTFLKSLAAREAPIPEHIDIYLLNSEYPPTELSALKAVIADAEAELKVCSFEYSLGSAGREDTDDVGSCLLAFGRPNGEDYGGRS